MRISVRKEDPGFAEPHITHEVRVLLDGVEQLSCLTADDEAGYVLRVARDADGRAIPDRLNGGAMTEEVRGRVEIIGAA